MHSIVALAIYLERGTSKSQSQLFTDCKRFSSRMALYLVPSIFSSTLTSLSVPSEEKHLNSLCCHHQFGPHLTRAPSTTDLLCLLHGLWQTSNVTSYRLLSTMGSFLPLSHKGQIIIVLWTDSPTWSVDLCSSPRVTMSHLIVFLIKAFFAWPVSLGGQLYLGRIAVVLYSFYTSDDGFNRILWDVQNMGYLFIT